MYVEKGTKHMLIAIAAVVFIVATIFAGISMASGVSPPQTIVVSQSMQHGTESSLGVIDTGDMIILKSKDKVTIQSYVDGYNSGYETFGLYGNVIVYDRGPSQDPVIHRAILWLEYNNDGTGTWSAPSLQNYPAYRWSCNGSTAESDPTLYEHLSGVLILSYLGYAGNLPPLSINLDNLPKVSGFITMGDNNSNFDQTGGIVSGLVTRDQIKSVAWIEIPWVGVFKMWFGPQTVGQDGFTPRERIDALVPNTIPCLAAAILLIIFLLVGISFLFDQRYYKKYKKELSKDINAPAPLFLVEDEIE